MTDDRNILANTWARAADPLKKVGYMDGAADGQKAVFQSSFDTGYRLGFNFGLKLGLRQSKISFENKSIESPFSDPRRINCQICLNSDITQENIVNLYNKQNNANVEC